MKLNISTVFLFSLIILVGIGAYFIFKPFLLAIVLAFLVSKLFSGWHKRIYNKTGKREMLAAILSCLMVFLILVIPLALISALVASEANQFYQSLESRNLGERVNALMENPLMEGLNSYLREVDLKSLAQSENFSQALKNTGGLAFRGAKGIYAGVSSFFFTIFVVFFALYYFFRDGEKLIEKLMKISPLKRGREELLINNFVSISKATLKGSFVIALVQGALLTLAYWVGGVSSPIFWGVISAFAALIPVLGAALIWVPAGVIMLFLGGAWQGVMILAVGALVVGLIDNLLRPRLVGNETHLHPLLVFFSTVGGILVFGFWGVLFGPIIIALFLSLLNIYATEFKGELKGS